MVWGVCSGDRFFRAWHPWNLGHLSMAQEFCLWLIRICHASSCSVRQGPWCLSPFYIHAKQFSYQTTRTHSVVGSLCVCMPISLSIVIYMYIKTYTSIYICIHMYIIYISIEAYTHAYVQTSCIHTHIHTHIHTSIQT